MKKNDLLILFRSNKTIFSFKEICMLWNQTNPNLIKQRIYYYIKTEKLYPLRRGLYAKDENYNRFELATKIYTPSYISLETILQKEGVVFQFYKSIFVLSYLSREIMCDNNSIFYRKIKNAALVNPKGIIKEANYYMASKERAFMDMLYLYKDYHFDNLDSINWGLCFDLLSVYNNKALEIRLNNFYRTKNNA